jgi:hypothetical protein
MRFAPPLAFLLVVLATACCSSPAAASPLSDFQAVRADYQQHNGDVTACRFSRAQLLNARGVGAQSQALVTYEPGFFAELDREIQRHTKGGCLSVSSQRGLVIARIRARGRESITVKNTGSTTAKLRGATLRDRSGNRIRLGVRGLKSGRLLRVFTGCARHHHRAVRRGARLYACKPGTVWNNKGDVVKLVNALGAVVAQRGYGTRRNAELISPSGFE